MAPRSAFWGGVTDKTGEKGKGHTASSLSLAQTCPLLLLSDFVPMKQVDLDGGTGLRSEG